MAKGDVVVKADKIRRWQKMGKYIKLALLILLLILIVIYLVLKVFFSDGSFSVSIDNNDMLYSGLAMYESRNDPMPKRRLSAKDVQFMDNISIKWLPSNIDIEAEGSHNGDNYVAYTFFIENQGNLMFNYWYNVAMTDVMRNADEALRIMIIINGERTVYYITSDETDELELFFGHTTPFDLPEELNMAKDTNTDRYDMYGILGIYNTTRQIMPTGIGQNGEIITSIETIDSGVKKVIYYNTQGIQSSKPFDGLNIVVTEYENGTKKTNKQIYKF